MNLLKYKDKKQDCFFLRVSEKEALQIIESLSRQIRTNNPNLVRPEFTTDEGEYFSIAMVTKDSTEKYFREGFII